MATDHAFSKVVWCSHAPELARWATTTLVNRVDALGGDRPLYLCEPTNPLGNIWTKPAIKDLLRLGGSGAVADLITLHRLAVQLRLSRDWLRGEALAGRLPCLRVGRKLLFNLSTVKWILAERVATSREISHAS